MAILTVANHRFIALWRFGPVNMACIRQWTYVCPPLGMFNALHITNQSTCIKWRFRFIYKKKPPLPLDHWTSAPPRTASGFGPSRVVHSRWCAGGDKPRTPATPGIPALPKHVPNCGFQISALLSTLRRHEAQDLALATVARAHALFAISPSGAGGVAPRAKRTATNS